MGVNRSAVVKSSSQVNKSRVNKEAWYRSFTFWTAGLHDDNCILSISSKLLNSMASVTKRLVQI